MSATKNPKLAPRPARATFSDELRDAIERSGSTPYAIGKAAGIDPGILSRFLAGRRGVTSETIDRLASTLGLHLVVPTRPRSRPRREPAPLPSPPHPLLLPGLDPAVGVDGDDPQEKF